MVLVLVQGNKQLCYEGWLTVRDPVRVKGGQMYLWEGKVTVRTAGSASVSA